ncbi:MAG: hypothetical protein ACFFG0_49605 [Candidatus Thorarchaeota archaeon]
MPEKKTINDLIAKRRLQMENSDVKQNIWNKEVGIRLVQNILLSFIAMIYSPGLSLSLYKRFIAMPTIIGSIISITRTVLLVYGLTFMKRLIGTMGKKEFC